MAFQGNSPTVSLSPTWEGIPTSATPSRSIGWRSAPIGLPTPASLMRFAQGLSCSRAVRSCSASAIRTCSAIAPKGAAFSPGSACGRVRDHRREIGFGGQLIADQGAAGELAHAGPLLDELDLEPKQHARLDRRPKLGALDGHEINQLAR